MFLVLVLGNIVNLEMFFLDEIFKVQLYECSITLAQTIVNYLFRLIDN